MNGTTHAGALGYSFRAQPGSVTKGGQLYVAQWRLGDGPWHLTRQGQRALEYPSRRLAEEAGEREAQAQMALAVKKLRVPY